MNDSDGSHSCQNKTQEITQDNPEDPGSHSLINVTCELNSQLSIRA